MSPIIKNYTRNLFSQADLVLVLSEQWKKWIKDALNVEQNIKILYNPCPNIKRHITAKENIILFAGTIIERKGYADLIKGFAKIASKYKD